MRIRSIKPEFWRSEDVAALSLDERLLFIGLWSYVDDNGVGRDSAALVAADLFALDMEGDPRDTLARVSRRLSKLSERGLIVRYRGDGRRLLAVRTWDRHQRIDKPNRARYPLPTCEDVASSDTLATPSRDPRETPAPGTGEQGNRGTGEQGSVGTGEQTYATASRSRTPSPPPADVIEAEIVETDRPTFDDFWSAYPRKVSKAAARKAWGKAVGAVDPEAIIEALPPLVAAWALHDPQFTPHPATWLNREGWEDDPVPPPRRNLTPQQRAYADDMAALALLAREPEPDEDR